jgi:hypothetical protein
MRRTLFVLFCLARFAAQVLIVALQFLGFVLFFPFSLFYLLLRRA